jgi:biotin synthase
LDTVKQIIGETHLEVHVSPGILSDETAQMLKEAGVAAVNHNLETAPSYFNKVCTTHSSVTRILTVKAVKKAGMKACCGGITGLGEEAKERVEMAFAVRDLDVDIIPLNILNKIDGTAISCAPLTIREILNAVAVFRLVNPSKIIKIAAGRESALGDYQGLVFHAGANGMLLGDYLTINGRSPIKDRTLVESLE